MSDTTTTPRTRKPADTPAPPEAEAAAPKAKPRPVDTELAVMRRLSRIFEKIKQTRPRAIPRLIDWLNDAFIRNPEPPTEKADPDFPYQGT